MISLRQRSSSRGFSLTEFMVASAVFLFVVAVAFTAFESGRESYRIGESNAELQQRTRLAFELSLEELRLAGFDYNRDGFETVYPDHPDEQLEWIGDSAIVFRANLDYSNTDGGREPELEIGPSDSDFGVVCCPVVTTGNDEIVAYALRSEDSAKNNDSIVFKVDLSAPRDAGWDPLDGAVVEEEDVEITNLDFTNANPPYALMRFHLDDDGELVERVMAANIRSLSFVFEDEDGLDYYCLNAEDDGSCLPGNQMPFASMGGADHLSGLDHVRRSGRADVRRIHVALTGMAEENDNRYVDPDDSAMPHRRKMVLDTVITPQNLGLRGRPDLQSEDAAAPTGVELCGGQCNTVRVDWNAVSAADTYQVNLYMAGQADPFFSAVTPGIAVPDTDPPRVYAVYQDLDHSAILDGASLLATVQSRTGDDRRSEESAYSPVVMLSDEVRLEAPADVTATGYDPARTGWPAVEDNLIEPLTIGTGEAVARENVILLSWVAPEYALDVYDQSAPGGSWTTRADGAAPALACDAEMADTDGDGATDRLRTRSRELRSDARYLVFRDFEPQFIPSADNYIGEVQGVTAISEGRVWFEDRTIHTYQGGVFQGTEHAIHACKTHYYRVRAVDACWSGADPASTTDPHLSPFSPPLNPDPTADDSDDVSALSPTQIGHAVPGFSVPSARPLRPENVLFTNLDDSNLDGDGMDGTISFDAVKQDSYAVLDAAGNMVPQPHDVVVTGYKVFAHPTNPNFSRNDALAGLNGVQLVKTIYIWDDHANRIAHDDENNDGVVQPDEDESWLDPADTGVPASGLRIDIASDAPRWYRVMGFWCEDEYTIPSESNPEAYDHGQLSKAVQFPCVFGGGPSSMIYTDASDYDNSVTAQGYTEIAEVTLLKAWLILIDPTSGERARSASPVDVDASGIAYFDAAHIATLTNNFGSGHYFLYVEMEDSNGCFGLSDPTEIDLGLGSCCLDFTGSRPHSQLSRLEGQHQVVEICGSLRMQIMDITLRIQKNGGKTRRFQNVWWSVDGSTPELIWSGDTIEPFIDRRSDPLVIEPGSTATLRFDMNRDFAGDDLYTTFNYRIGGQPGTCTFETLGL